MRRSAPLAPAAPAPRADRARPSRWPRPGLKRPAAPERCEVVGGDFFVALPENADAYLMSHVLHDWDDDLCVTILRNCRGAMDPDGRLLIVEMVLPPGGEPHPGQMLDMVMLVIAAGM